MQSVVELVACHKEELVRIRDTSRLKDERNRAHNLLSLSNGLSQRAVHRALGHARSTIGRVVRRFRTGSFDGVRDRRR